MKAQLLLALLASAGLAGCAADADAPETVVLVGQGLEGDQGTIHGHIYAEWGEPLRDVRVSVLGTSATGRTDGEGHFMFIGIPTGTKTVRIEEDRFLPEERKVTLGAGESAHVEVTLKLVDQSGGARPHLHDWWAGMAAITIADVRMYWNNPYNNDPTIRFFGEGNPVTGANPLHGTHRQNNNQTGEDPDYLMRVPVPELLENGNPALVYPGTGSVEVTVDWDAPTTRKSRVGVVAIPPGGGYDDLRFMGAPIASGETASLQVPANRTDNGHQPWSQWSFFLYNPHEAGGDDTLVEFTYGEDFHVVVEVVKGNAVPFEPPHRDFWADGPVKTLQIYDEQVIDPLNARDWRVRNSGHLFLPEGVLIPPGTKRIEMQLVYGSAEQTNDAIPGDRVVTFRTADQNKWTTGLEEYRRSGGTPCETEQAGAKCIAYAFDVESSWTDQYYQQDSLWTFLSSDAGNEDNRNYSTEGGDFVFILGLTLYGPGA
jgi:hypothetical protein